MINDYILGIQHIGLPTNKYDESINFYKKLCFELVREEQNNDKRVAFLNIKDITIELYEDESVNPFPGSWDHIAINVTNIEKVYQMIKQLLDIDDITIYTLPFYENGVSYFTIIGPNNEKIEFNQYL